MPVTIEQAVVLFAFYAFCGWLVEVAYRSFQARRFVNPGFLRGPFVPLYAMGASCIVLLGRPLEGLHPVVQVPIYGVVLTALEYAVGWLLEKWLHVKLWTYEDSRYNWQGRICLSFSAAWTGLAVVFSLWIHPAVLWVAGRGDPQILRLTAMMFVGYLTLDTMTAVAEIRAFRLFLGRLQSDFVTRRDFELERQLGRLRRLLEAFPDLNRQLFAVMKKNLQGALPKLWVQNFHRFLTGVGKPPASRGKPPVSRGKPPVSRGKRTALARLRRLVWLPLRSVPGRLRSVPGRLQAGLLRRRPSRVEYAALVADILAHPEFLRTREFPHHKHVTIFTHACAVSYLSYSICKKFGLDYRSAARGGLLHDFFLYDWRNHDVPDLPREKFHGLAHPKIALENARTHFELNDIERDCILRHMWPLTPMPPRTREAFIVSMVDKWVASREFLRRRPAGPADPRDGKVP
ncbi:MAG: hypothetical protein CVU65_01215 [Deltaproteobacteria bacterium HGW-Deltaproteobacteria-22]|nr:MAG: hypothetical protein CVU65_01215 [Deltaproteobacteria bacterium HGW-Deltaproteobacteria-22]